MNPGEIHFYREQRPSVWAVALVGALLLHILIILALLVARPFDGRPILPAEPRPIQLVFSRPEAPPEPSRFTELPPDRADQVPERADFLSNVDSRARDEIPGGEANALPRLEGRSEAPQVRMDAGEAASVPPPETSPVAAAPRPESGPRSRQDPLAGLVRRQPPADPFRADPRGLSDLFEEEMFQPQGNAELSGIVSMNTEAWAYAPWLMAFKREFVKNWFAPSAFHMGLIHGSNIVELEVARDGTMKRLEVLDEDGHESLTRSSVSAFHATAPFRPLPADFPEETLILRIRLVYPSRTPK